MESNLYRGNNKVNQPLKPYILYICLINSGS